MRTSNPVLNEKKLFSSVGAIPATDVMTIDGTVNKTIISLLITAGVAWWAFVTPGLQVMVLPSILIGLVLAIIISFKQSLAPILTPAYAAIEGVALGVISAIYEAQFQGIVTQAISLTFGTLFCLLLAYKSGWIKVTNTFRKAVVAATGAIFLVYMISIIASLFGANLPFLHSNGIMGIGISLVIVGVAAMNLVLDFDLIEKLSSSRAAPKYFEWYGAFALLVTLIWLYLEILRLLSKIMSRD